MLDCNSSNGMRSLQKKRFEQLHFRLRIGQLAEPIAEAVRRRSPHVLKPNCHIAEAIDGLAHKLRKASGLEDHADQFSHVGVVDDLVHRPRSHQQRCRTPQCGCPFRAIEQKVARQVEDHLDAAAGEHALAPVRQIGRIRVPERADRAGEGRGGDALQVEQSDLDTVIARIAEAKKPVQPRASLRSAGA